jgi:hypothetical protein
MTDRFVDGDAQNNNLYGDEYRPGHLTFNQGEEVTDAATRLVNTLKVTAPPRNREEEARRAREKSRERFGSP